LTFSLKGVSYNDPDYFTAGVFSSILGEGMSSRLFQEVREIRGLAYSIYSWNSSQEDTGTFGVYAGTSPKDAEELLKVIVDEYHKALKTIDEREVMRAKTQMKAGLLMGMERPMTRCELAVGHTFAMGRVMSAEELVEKIERITVEDVRRLGGRLLVNAHPVLCSIGPVYEVKDYHETLQGLSL
jgi:predicted Zn-dependent peptidase